MNCLAKILLTTLLLIIGSKSAHAQECEYLYDKDDAGKVYKETAARISGDNIIWFVNRHDSILVVLKAHFEHYPQAFQSAVNEDTLSFAFWSGHSTSLKAIEAPLPIRHHTRNRAGHHPIPAYYNWTTYFATYYCDRATAKQISESLTTNVTASFGQTKVSFSVKEKRGERIAKAARCILM